MTNASQQPLFSATSNLPSSRHAPNVELTSRRARFDHDIRLPCPWNAEDPPLQLGRNGSFFGIDFAHPEDIRNLLVLGETGAGKTMSAVVPYLKAALSYRLLNEKQATVFVVDPKRELRGACETFLGDAKNLDRLIVLGENASPVRFFR
jgi:type IV secretory pathway VirB4 component